MAQNIWKQHFKIFELTEIMRQRDERTYAEFLNRLRESPLDEADTAYIKTRIIDENHPLIPDASYITLTNARAEKLNEDFFAKSSSQKHFFKCRDVPHNTKQESPLGI